MFVAAEGAIDALMDYSRKLSLERAPKCFKNNEKLQFNQRYLFSNCISLPRGWAAGPPVPHQQGAVLGRGLPRSCPVPISSPGGQSRAEPHRCALPGAGKWLLQLLRGITQTSPQAKFLIKAMRENRTCVAHVKTIAVRISC